MVPPIFSGASGRWSYGFLRSPPDRSIFVDCDLRKLDLTPRVLMKSSSLDSSPPYTDLLHSPWYGPGVVDLPACPAYKLLVPPYTLSVSIGRLYGFTEELKSEAPVSLYV